MVSGVPRIGVETAYSHVIITKVSISAFVIGVRTIHEQWFTVACSIQRVMFCFHMPALIKHVFICRYIFMATYSVAPPFREAKFCRMPSCLTNQCTPRVKKGCGHLFRLHTLQMCWRCCTIGSQTGRQTLGASLLTTPNRPSKITNYFSSLNSVLETATHFSVGFVLNLKIPLRMGIWKVGWTTLVQTEACVTMTANCTEYINFLEAHNRSVGQ
jgi:hypothetical protein